MKKNRLGECYRSVTGGGGRERKRKRDKEERGHTVRETRNMRASVRNKRGKYMLDKKKRE